MIVHSNDKNMEVIKLTLHTPMISTIEVIKFALFCQRRWVSIRYVASMIMRVHLRKGQYEDHTLHKRLEVSLVCSLDVEILLGH